MNDDVSSPDGNTFRAFADGLRVWPANVAAFIRGGSAGLWLPQYVSPSTPLPVGPAKGPVTDISGAITADHQDEILDPANPSRNWFHLVNRDAATMLFLNFGAPAGSVTGPAAGAYPIAPGEDFAMPLAGFLSTDDIHLWSMLAGHLFLAKKG